MREQITIHDRRASGAPGGTPPPADAARKRMRHCTAMEFGRRPSDPAARRPMKAVEPEPPATLDEELLGAEITSVLATETDETRIARMSEELRASFETMSQVSCG